MTAVLSCRNLSRRFGAVHAVDDVDLDVEPGARHALIGPNGAGKSTLLHLLSGVLSPSSGAVALEGRDISRLSVSRRSRLGLSQTFQHSLLFLSMTARENVALAVARRHGVRPWPRRRVHSAVADRAGQALGTVGLADRSEVPAGSLAHGERRQLDIAVTLACEPRLLLLDEPAAGMSPAEVERLGALIELIPPEVTVLFVEHDLELVFRLATTVTVLHLGAELITGTPDEVRASDAVQEAYLGTEGQHTDLFLRPEPAVDPASR